MKVKPLVPIFLASILSLGATPQVSQYPFEDGDLPSLVKLAKSNSGVSGRRLVQLVKEYGIDFEPTDDYLENLQNAGAKKGLLDALRAAKRVKRPGETQQAAPSLYGVGAEVEPLVAVYKPEPSYSEEAYRAKLNGVLVLWIVVSSHGNVVDVKEVSEPLGEGLDEKAIHTIGTWKFKPPTRSGAPVAIHTAVEVSFRTS